MERVREGTQMGFHCQGKLSYIDYAEHKSEGGK